MAFTAPTGPVIDDPIRPKARWYWIGGLVMVGAVVGAIAWFVTGLMAIDDTVDGFGRVPFPEGGTITLDEPGDYVIYTEGSQITPAVSGLTVTVTGPDGDEVDTAFYSGSLTYEFGDRSGSAQETFTADQAGDYRIESDSLGSGNVTSYAVGDSIGGDLVSVLVGGFVIGGLGVVMGAIVLIVTGVRRSRAKRGRRPPTLPPSSWGQAPQAWGPQPPPPQAGWGRPPEPGPPPPGWNRPAPGAPPPPPTTGGSGPSPPPGWPT